ncbi:Na+/H+ antiporter subunit E [Georgenia muralis]|uniref:Multisubunit sodium/proton antiporter MrpE subunit n=1 Tax=Georgenia muralis TaxID=154117 RepID=A0A3N4ZL96_9MICO|nr:Na+/H+ antiporter subunit E [Georgenia muralis]RPF26548.1 multisubunit sodium/proton antiporter MrpE subunit [Georgenia muralis]
MNADASAPTRAVPRRPRLRPRTSWGALAWLTGVWVLLWGDITMANAVAGLLVALLVTWVAPLPRAPFDGRFRPLGVLRLVVRFAVDVALASAQIAWMVLRRRQPTGAVIRVRLRSHSDTYLAATSGMVSLVPGSIVVEAHRLTGTLYIHVFDVDLAGGLERAHRSVLEQEERLLRAFASRDQLTDAGYVPGSSPRRGRLAEGEAR